MFTHEQAIELKQKMDVKKFYRQYLELSQSGSSIRTTCPFHNSSGKHFAIDADSGIWKCYSSDCGGGDMISFYRKITGKGFSQAIMDMAESQGIEIKISEKAKQEFELRKNIYKLNLFIANLYQKSLAQNKDAQEYLIKRRFDMETIQKFKIGCIPKYNLQEISTDITPMLNKAGLLRQNKDNNKYHNFFSNRRISIPFMDENGNIVGFSSRAIDDGVKPKYLHSKASDTFEKNKLLYGHNVARNKMKETKTVILVEGQIDCIRAHQYGIENCVAMCGSTITEQQAKTLSTSVKNYYLIIEDKVSEDMLDRTYDMIAASDYFAKVKVIKLCEDCKKMDLDEFLLTYGKAAFLEKIKRAKPYHEHKLIDSLKKINYKTIDEKKYHVYNNRKYICKIKDAIDRSQYITMLSDKLELPEQDIRRVIARAELADSGITGSYDERKDNRQYVSQLYILASFFSKFEIAKVYEIVNNLKIQNKLQNNFKKIFTKIIDTILTNGNNCDIINILHSSDIMNEEELRILTDAYFRRDEFDYLDDEEDLKLLLVNQLENLR